jgi:hypothetical protein
MRKRTRPGKLQRLGDVLEKVLKKQAVPLPSRDQELITAWRKAVGQQVAAQTFPDRLRRETLYVRVSTSVWMHQLQFMKQDILPRINALLNHREVKSLHFTLGEIPPIPASPGDAPADGPVRLKARDRKMIEESTARLRDPELREIFRRVMVKEISRRRLKESQDR